MTPSYALTNQMEDFTPPVAVKRRVGTLSHPGAARSSKADDVNRESPFVHPCAVTCTHQIRTPSFLVESPRHACVPLVWQFTPVPRADPGQAACSHDRE